MMIRTHPLSTTAATLHASLCTSAAGFVPLHAILDYVGKGAALDDEEEQERLQAELVSCCTELELCGMLEVRDPIGGQGCREIRAVDGRSVHRTA